ncbi:hypothetical protein EVAR_51947_1 [Eumeta japonica]|uniref:Uncharacterized protein n=1 Tax=Eumeta variegata TaxID=151549 RepID=A0A4C1YH08_EUMVA|nr:hypothetical protein EVAR_51947_1 [Eumeta japonica]
MNAPGSSTTRPDIYSGGHNLINKAADSGHFNAGTGEIRYFIISWLASRDSIVGAAAAPVTPEMALKLEQLWLFIEIPSTLYSDNQPERHVQAFNVWSVGKQPLTYEHANYCNPVRKPTTMIQNLLKIPPKEGGEAIEEEVVPQSSINVISINGNNEQEPCNSNSDESEMDVEATDSNGQFKLNEKYLYFVGKSWPSYWPPVTGSGRTARVDLIYGSIASTSVDLSPEYDHTEVTTKLRAKERTARGPTPMEHCCVLYETVNQMQLLVLWARNPVGHFYRNNIGICGDVN